MFNFLYRFRYRATSHKTGDLSYTAENVLEASARQIHTIDPETDEQWRRLKSTLESERSIGNERRIVVRKVFWKPALSFAFVCSVIVISCILWLRHSSSRIYETAKGQHITITLQDSTEVTLNYLSELKVNRSFLENARHVTLNGEALFHVRRNGTPFIIATDIGTIQVLGTRFNVRVRDNKMEVAVLSGSVKVSVNKSGMDSSIVLTKGQIIVCDKNHYPDVPGTLPFSDYPGWTQGKFMFYRTDLLSACKEMESQFGVIIRIKTPPLSDGTITGIVNGESIEAALATLSQLTGNSYRYENGSYIIY